MLPTTAIKRALRPSDKADFSVGFMGASSVGRGERAPLQGHETADNIEEPANRRVEVVVR